MKFAKHEKWHSLRCVFHEKTYPLIELVAKYRKNYCQDVGFEIGVSSQSKIVLIDSATGYLSTEIFDHVQILSQQWQISPLIRVKYLNF